MKRILMLASGLLAIVLLAASAGTSVPAADDHAHAMPSGDETPFDLQFIDGMTVHHKGAIEMANAVLAQAEHGELKEFAQRVIEAQTAEIAQMAAWRTDWFGSASPATTTEMEMGTMEISDDSAKPFDQRFLEAMISHHEGAVEMAEMAAQTSERPELVTFAEKIAADQQAEISQMQSWLAEWYE